MAHLERLLRELRARQEETQLDDLYRHIVFVSLAKGKGQPVTREMVRQPREEEGI